MEDQIILTEQSDTEEFECSLLEEKLSIIKDELKHLKKKEYQFKNIIKSFIRLLLQK